MTDTSAPAGRGHAARGARRWAVGLSTWAAVVLTGVFAGSASRAGTGTTVSVSGATAGTQSVGPRTPPPAAVPKATSPSRAKPAPTPTSRQPSAR